MSSRGSRGVGRTGPLLEDRPEAYRRGVSFRRELGRFDTAMVVVGGFIDAGIFINPYIVAQRPIMPLHYSPGYCQ